MTKIRPPIDLKLILSYSDTFFTSIGLLLNFLLLYLIVNKTPARLTDYRRVLLQNCLVDLCYNVMQFITKTQTDYKNGNFFMIYTNDFGPIDPILGDFLVSTFVLTLFFTLVSLPVQFVYRYFLIVKNTKLTNKQYFLMLIPSIFFALSYSGYCVFAVWPKEPLYSDNAKLLQADPFYFRELPNFSTAYIEDWPLMTMFIYCYFLAFTSYTIIIWSSYAVWKHLKRMQHHMSHQMRDANQQITKTLIMQATLPVFVCLIPIACTVTMVFLRANIPGLGLVISFFFAWIPIANTLVTITVVKSYRQAVTQFFPQILWGGQVGPVPDATSTLRETMIATI